MALENVPFKMQTQYIRLLMEGWVNKACDDEDCWTPIDVGVGGAGKQGLLAVLSPGLLPFQLALIHALLAIRVYFSLDLISTNSLLYIVDLSC